MFRFGGEEFVVLVGPLSRESMENVCERFRRAVEWKKFGKLERVTVSIGITRVSPLDVPAEIIGEADQAMYYAKGNGRNQLAMYEDLLAAGKIAQAEPGSEVELFRQAV